MPGQRRRSGKKPLSLVLKSDCKTIIASGSRTYIRTTSMGPIATGATAGSNNDHYIKYWEKRNGFLTEIIDGSSENFLAPTNS